MKEFHILLFDGFETLDAIGPAEIIGEMPDAFTLFYRSLRGGIATSAQGLRADTMPAADIRPGGVLLIPGGIGTRTLIQDEQAMRDITRLVRKSEYTLTVCTGALVLAKTGLIDGLRATSNKKLFFWTEAVNPGVRWVKRARWVNDGKYYTSSGVSAGMDMVLGFVDDTVGHEAAKTNADNMEYIWNEDKDFDPFHTE